jgi:hypothetical protein
VVEPSRPCLVSDRLRACALGWITRMLCVVGNSPQDEVVFGRYRLIELLGPRRHG